MDLYLVLYVPVQLLKFFRKKIWYHLKAQAASSQQASQAIRYNSSVHTKYKIMEKLHFIMALTNVLTGMRMNRASCEHNKFKNNVQIPNYFSLVYYIL